MVDTSAAVCRAIETRSPRVRTHCGALEALAADLHFDVVIASHPLNKRLYVIRLNDGRRANLWRMGGAFPVGAGLRVKLVELVGDQAYYEPIHS